MTAGFVAVPTIVPLKAFTAGERKNHVDTATKIELRSGAHVSVLHALLSCFATVHALAHTYSYMYAVHTHADVCFETHYVVTGMQLCNIRVRLVTMVTVHVSAPNCKNEVLPPMHPRPQTQTGQ